MALDRILHYGEPLRSEAEVAAKRRVNRMRSVTAKHRELVWSPSGWDWALTVDVDFDDYDVPRINEVRDAAGKPIPLEALWFEGKPLEDVLAEWICNGGTS